MSSVMLSLGEFQFGVSTLEYQALKTSMSWRWAKKDRLGRVPGKQFQGRDATTKNLTIAIYPQSKADLGRFEEIKALGNAGEPLRLVAGGSRYVDGVLVPAGADLGLWVMDKLDLDESAFMTDGTALAQTGSLSISEYGDDA